MNGWAISYGRTSTLAFRTPRGHWLALLVVLAGIALPDCCLNGRHMLGVGMDGFGPICRAGF